MGTKIESAKNEKKEEEVAGEKDGSVVLRNRDCWD